MNVIGSRPDGWWRDRDAAVRGFVARLQALHATTGHAVTVVFDGRPPAGLEEGEHAGVAVRYAHRSGPDAADDRIVELLGAADPATVTVVTSDRALTARARRRAATVTGAGWLLSRLDEVGQ